MRSRTRTALSVLAAGVVVLTTTTAATATGAGGWDHLGDGGALDVLTGTPSVLYARSATQLIAGGAFLDAGGRANADYVASWDGSAWHAVAPGLNGAVHAIAYDGTHIIVGGVFTDAGGHAGLDHLARLGSSGWEPVCNSSGPAFSGSVDALEVIGNTVYVGGSFQDGAGIASADYLVACDLATGTAMSTVPGEPDAFTGPVYALTVDTDNNLYAGGAFTNLAQLTAADYAAFLDTGSGGVPGSWHAMGSGAGSGGGAITSFVRSIASHAGNVYVGSDALDIADIAQADHVARWNGSSWSAMGADSAGTDGWFPPSAFFYGMATYGSLVFATGSFQNANGIARADDIAYFDGSHWQPIGSNGAGNGPWVGNGLTLAMQGNNLYAGGSFTAAGGDSSAKYVTYFATLRPDARIGVARTGPFTGNGVYSATAAGETKTITVARGHAGTFFVDIQNDGIRPHAFTVVGTGSASGYSVTYVNGTKDVTSGVRGGTFSTGVLQPGGRLTLKLVVRLGAKAVSVGAFLTKAKGAGPADAVRARVQAS